MRKYKYITLADRVLIERLYNLGTAPATVAVAIDVSLATLYRELQKGCTGVCDPATGRKVYNAHQAQTRFDRNIKQRGRTAAKKKQEVHNELETGNH